MVNQVRRGPVPGDPRAEIAEALERFAGRDVRFFLPADRRATDAALAIGPDHRRGGATSSRCARAPVDGAIRCSGCPEPAAGRAPWRSRRAG